MDRRERLARARLYVVTDGRQSRGDLSAFLDTVLSAGADIIQLRDKDAEAGDLLRWGETFRKQAAKHDALFFVNDRPDVAAVLEADGVHVGQNDLPVEASRRFVGREKLLGLSTHDPEQLEAAPPDADYVCVGPVFETPTKEGRPGTGLDYVRFAVDREDRPWFAIGGINEETLPDVVEAGARRIVVVRAVTEADDPAEAVRRLLKALPEL
ncbi:MAG TPA: thiamine phosphate synthase [Actinomycetota bacterium]|nr:thiamine phosphate synthase [Actinomycetota bacterium]